jgi:hypothetical protein
MHALHVDAVPLLRQLLPQADAVHSLRAAGSVPGQLLPQAAAVRPVPHAQLLPGQLLPQTNAESLLAGRSLQLPLPAAGTARRDGCARGDTREVKFARDPHRRAPTPLGIPRDFS